MTVECPLTTCIHNLNDRGKKGLCRLEHIELKWRFAADMGNGNLVCVECLYFTLPGDLGG
jgi:hypothetical protein